MAVTISIEVELAWGVHDIDERAHLSADGGPERRALRRLLDHCDQVGVPVSFDVVGHLLEGDCDGDHDGPHRDGWFDADPGTDPERAPLFYAPDAVREIRDRSAGHELCTHTYSHLVCGPADAETVGWELDRAQDGLRALTGSETMSIVPPRHSEPDAETLRDAGIEITRVSRDTSGNGKAARARELVVGPHPVFEPRLVDGVVETYCTSYPSLVSSTLPSGQRAPPAPFRALPVGVRQALHRRYLSRAVDAAVESDGDCHLWCHLYDLANDAQWPPVRDFLTELANRRDRGEVEALTMAALNDRVRARSRAAVADD
ncbi:polysaccharide deacetylase family protein [Halobacterium jilantaiense]|uniref:Peptidoglycan/xylan/chitin deacetylase, PgdA/CDA1 family n=1 Tax=Halobacterium jilantaiense TaxID=355548 RepID=A0A1I0NU78_9EURY|nr:polysaccharide deacetylase family protein [Halobacterium jilantaiense]SEW04945.1 Peptidoglycan/xylan/chitin deacetylase, PgdA/CDA1 family [Halobacterium jilantaiense]